jgi:hypothetical protein
MKTLSVLLVAVAQAAEPGDIMCTLTGFFDSIAEPACTPEDKGLGQKINLIDATARKTNTPGFSMTANYWVE